MNYPTHNYRIKPWFVVLIASLLLPLTACDQSSSNKPSTVQPAPAHFRLTNVTGTTPSLEFTLTDSATGKTVTADSYKGKYVMMYFGYTHCPDVCPTTLARMSRALKQLGERLDKNIQILFVTLDPARDSAKLLTEYTHNFGTHVAGLRGTDAQIQRTANRYRVAYGAGKRDKYGNYEVAHGSAIYIFDTTGKARLMAKATDPAFSISHDMRMLMNGA